MISSRLIKSNDVAAGCEDIVDAYDPFGDSSGLALYQLNGNANDVSGNYNGTASNVTYGTGVFGQAGVFNGSTSGINLGNGLVSSLTALSTSIWFNTDNISLNAQILLDLGFSSTGNGLQIFIQSGGNIVYRVNSGGSNVFQEIINGVISNNTWYNIIATFENTTSGAYKLYLNNSLIASGNSSQTGSISFASTGLYLGHYNQTFSRFDGSIDQVRIFNTALTPLEIEALYTEESCLCGGTVDTLDILDDSSCIATYQFDGNTNDLSGNYPLTDYVGGAYATYTVGEFDLALAMRSNIEQSNYIANLNIPNHNSESFWIKVNSLDDDDDVVFAYYIRRQGYTVPVVWTSAGGVFLDSADTLPIGVWKHVVLSIDGTTLSVYYDGQLQNTKTVASGTLLNGVGIIADDALTTARFEADQVRIFNKALNSTEVTTLYNETACTPAACVSGTTNTLDILGDGSCIATYTLDGTPADLSGNYNGVQTDVNYPQGYFDLAGVFNGSTSHIDFPSPVPGTNTPASFSCWFKFNSGFSSGVQTIIGAANMTTSAGIITLYIRYASTGNYYIEPSRGYNSYIYYTDTTNYPTVALSADTWYNVVFTYGASNEAKIYLNGILVSTTNLTIPSGPTANSNVLALGQYRDNTLQFNGSIDQVRIFNKALSASEVTTLYNETPCN